MRIVVALSLAVAVAMAATPARASGEPPASTIYVPAVDTPWPGKIFVAHDEWAISDYGYVRTRASARRLTLNLASWFTGGRPGRFLAYSNFYGLIGQEIAATLTAAGHSWTVDMALPPTLATLLQYDAVFVGGDEVDNGVLIDYVRAGGGVYLEGGTGLGGNVWEAAHWNTFLHTFGLGLGSPYDTSRLPGIYPVLSSSPIFEGVTELYEQVGNPVLKLDPLDPYVQILLPHNGHGLFATYSTPVIPVALEVCQRLSDARDAWLTVTVRGAGDFDVRRLDPRSVRLLGAAPVLARLGHGSTAPPGRRLGKTRADRCRPGGGDGILDLTLIFRARDVMRAAEAILAHRLYDDDLVALTLTGRLTAELGGTPIVGEAVVEVKGERRPREHHHRHRHHHHRHDHGR
jgi:hypothetical protein